jgi:hypothetical protein
METLFVGKSMRPILGLYWFPAARDCCPPVQITAIKALIETWWPSGPSAPRNPMGAYASVPSPKSLGFRRRSVGCFSRRERSAHIWIDTVERATRKNSQPAAARRVALNMGRRQRCSSITYRFRYAPSNCQSGSDRLAGGPF